MTVEERKKLAEDIADILAQRQTPSDCHAFTIEEREAIRDLVKVKKKAIQTTFWVVGALIIWAVKGIGTFLFTHLSFKWPGN